jgi:hypothetical protein
MKARIVLDDFRAFQAKGFSVILPTLARVNFSAKSRLGSLFLSPLPNKVVIYSLGHCPAPLPLTPTSPLTH